MAQYKTIAGPIGLQVQSGEDYEYAVKKYAAIIDAEAVGGWELHLIQQIAVKKWLWYTVIIGAVLGAILGFVIVKNMGGRGGPSEEAIFGGLFIGAAIGAILGCFGIRNVTEFFNMLIFVNRDSAFSTKNIDASLASSLTSQKGKEKATEGFYIAAKETGLRSGADKTSSIVQVIGKGETVEFVSSSIDTDIFMAKTSSGDTGYCLLSDFYKDVD